MGDRTPRPWYETYFNTDYLRIHRRLLEASVVQEVDFIVTALGLKPGAAVLDVPCGHGRHSLELARRGFRVTGVDLSAEFLDLGRRQAEREGLAIRFLRGDMRRLNFTAEFEAAVNLFNSFGYFGSAGDLQVLRGISRALKPEGRLLLEVGNRDYYLLHAHPTSWEELPDCYVLYRFAFCARTGTAHSEHIIIDKETRDVRSYEMEVRMYTFPELSEMLTAVGLKPYGVYGDWDGSAFTTEARRMLVLAVKA